MKRLVVFLLYDPEGIVDASVVRLLQGLRPHAERIAVVSNGELQDASKQQLATLCDSILTRSNTGYDVGAYRAMLERIGFAELAQYDEVLLANSTMFGPLTSFDELFARMDAKEIDFWGMTDHPAVSPHPYTGRGTMREHLQTYWIAFRRPLLSSDTFQQFWGELPVPTTYNEVVTRFETVLTAHFADAGFTWTAAYPAADFGVPNPTTEAPLSLLRAGCPLFKKRLYFHGTEWLLDAGVSTARVTEAAVAAGFPRETIAEGIMRRTTADQATVALGALFVVPEGVDERATSTAATCTRVAGRPWRTLYTDEDAVAKWGELVFCGPADEGGTQDLGDGTVARLDNARAAVLDKPDFVASLFASNPMMGTAVPLLQLQGTEMVGPLNLAEVEISEKIGALLGLRAHPSKRGPICAYQGVAVYRKSALVGFAQRIRDAGGWEHLEEVAGSGETLELALDQLIADHMITRGFYAGQVTTETELRIEAPLWMADAQRNYARFRGYSEYAYDSRIRPPGLIHNTGEWVKEHSPGLFDALYAPYKWLRGLR